MNNQKARKRFLPALIMAIFGALLYGVMTFRVMSGPFTTGGALLLYFPTSLLLRCMGFNLGQFPQDSFFRTAAFFILVNAVVGGMIFFVIFFVIGEWLRFFISLFINKRDHEK